MNSWGKNSTRRRGTLFIVAKILEIANKGSSKTHIMYDANLSFQMINEYLKFMLGVNLLEESVENKKRVYKATEKGVCFIDRSYDLAALLEAEGDNKNSLKIPPQHLLRNTC